MRHVEAQTERTQNPKEQTCARFNTTTFHTRNIRFTCTDALGKLLLRHTLMFASVADNLTYAISISLLAESFAFCTALNTEASVHHLINAHNVISSIHNILFLVE